MSVTSPVTGRVTGIVASGVTRSIGHRTTGVNFASLLFSADEVGASYEIWKPDTLFQDVNGTQPVTASGQTVRLMLDASKGLSRGSERSSQIPNVYTFTSDPNATSFTIPNNLGGVGSSDDQRYFEVTFEIVSITAGGVSLRLKTGKASPIFSTTGVHRVFVLSGTGIATAIRTAGSTTTAQVTNVSIRELLGNHAYQADADKAPVYTVADGLAYLAFDGVDDFLETAAIDFTGTDKMTVFAGVRKLSDTAAGMVVELSASATANDGAFEMRAPRSGGAANYRILARGVTEAQEAIAATFASPVSNVLTGIIDFAAPLIAIRANGLEINAKTLSMGSGNYGNHKLYIGMRAGSSLPFNGRIYGLTIRGAETPLETIRKVEAELAKRAGITL